MPQMIATKQFRVSETGKMVGPDSGIFEVSDAAARHYETRGMAYPVANRAKASGGASNKAADTGPLSGRGGKTGAARTAQSSRAAPARKSATSKRSKAARK